MKLLWSAVVVSCIWDWGLGIVELCRLSTTHQGLACFLQKILTPRQACFGTASQRRFSHDRCLILEDKCPRWSAWHLCLSPLLRESRFPLASVCTHRPVCYAPVFSSESERWEDKESPENALLFSLPEASMQFYFFFWFPEFSFHYMKYEVYPSTSWSGIW